MAKTCEQLTGFGQEISCFLIEHSIVLTLTSYDFDISAQMKYGDCYVYAAMYDENGVMIGIDRVPLSMKDDTKISLDKKDNAKNVNIFVLSSQLQPISEKKTVKLVEE